MILQTMIYGVEPNLKLTFPKIDVPELKSQFFYWKSNRTNLSLFGAPTEHNKMHLSSYNITSIVSFKFRRKMKLIEIN